MDADTTQIRWRAFRRSPSIAPACHEAMHCYHKRMEALAKLTIPVLCLIWLAFSIWTAFWIIPPLVTALFPPADAIRTVTAEGTITLKLALGQPVALVLPEAVSTVTTGIKKDALLVSKDNMNVGFIATHPEMPPNRNVVVGVSGQVYMVMVELAPPGKRGDDIVYVTHNWRGESMDADTTQNIWKVVSLLGLTTWIVHVGLRATWCLWIQPLSLVVFVVGLLGLFFS